MVSRLPLPPPVSRPQLFDQMQNSPFKPPSGTGSSIRASTARFGTEYATRVSSWTVSSRLPSGLKSNGRAGVQSPQHTGLPVALATVALVLRSISSISPVGSMLAPRFPFGFVSMTYDMRTASWSTATRRCR